MRILRNDNNGIWGYCYISVTQEEFDKLKSYSSLQFRPYTFDLPNGDGSGGIRGRATLWRDEANRRECYVLNGQLYK